MCQKCWDHIPEVRAHVREVERAYINITAQLDRCAVTEPEREQLLVLTAQLLRLRHDAIQLLAQLENSMRACTN